MEVFVSKRYFLKQCSRVSPFPCGDVHGQKIVFILMGAASTLLLVKLSVVSKGLRKLLVISCGKNNKAKTFTTYLYWKVVSATLRWKNTTTINISIRKKRKSLQEHYFFLGKNWNADKKNKRWRKMVWLMPNQMVKNKRSGVIMGVHTWPLNFSKFLQHASSKAKHICFKLPT